MFHIAKIKSINAFKAQIKLRHLEDLISNKLGKTIEIEFDIAIDIKNLHLDIMHVHNMIIHLNILQNKVKCNIFQN